MKKITAIEKRARKATMQLRRDTLLNGNSFMVYDTQLPNGQYYMEYPDGEIKIVTISHKKNDFIVQQELNEDEVHAIRRKLDLQPVF